MDVPYAQAPPSAQTIFENGQYQDRPTPQQESSLPQTKNGQQELSGTRAQLLAIQRRILEHVGKTLGRNVGWSAILPTLEPKDELDEVDLNDDPADSSDKEHSDEEEAEPEKPISQAAMVGISASALKDAASGIEQFRQFYEVCVELIRSWKTAHNVLDFERLDREALYGSGPDQSW